MQVTSEESYLFKALSTLATSINPNWLPQGFGTVGDATPAATANHLYFPTSAGTVFGQPIPAAYHKYILVGNGIAFVATDLTTYRANGNVSSGNADPVNGGKAYNIAMADFIAWLHTYDSGLLASGLVKSGDSAPAAVLNTAYRAIEDGTIFGIANVKKGDLLTCRNVSTGYSVEPLEESTQKVIRLNKSVGNSYFSKKTVVPNSVARGYYNSSGILTGTGGSLYNYAIINCTSDNTVYEFTLIVGGFWTDLTAIQIVETATGLLLQKELPRNLNDLKKSMILNNGQSLILSYRDSLAGSYPLITAYNAENFDKGIFQKVNSDSGINVVHSWIHDKFIVTIDTEIDFGGVRSSSGFKYSNKIRCYNGETYVYNGEISGNVGVVFFDINDNPLYGISESTHGNFTVPNDSSIEYMIVNDRSGKDDEEIYLIKVTGAGYANSTEISDIKKDIGFSLFTSWIHDKFIVTIDTEIDFGGVRSSSGFKYSNKIRCSKNEIYFYNGTANGNAGVVFFDIYDNPLYGISTTILDKIVVPDDDAIKYMIVNDRSGTAESELKCYILDSSKTERKIFSFEIEESNRRLLRQEEANPFIWNAFDKGYVSFTQDDASTDFDAIKTLCENYNIPFCPAVPWETLDTDSIVLKLQQIISNGGEVLAHGYTPLEGDDPVSEYIKYFRDSKRAFVEKGFDISTIIMAGGTVSVPVDKSVTQAWCLRYYNMSDLLGTTPQYTLNRSRPSDGATESEQIAYLRGLIDDAIANNKWVRIYTHNFTQTTQAALEDLFSYINTYVTAGTLEKVTWKYMYDQFKSSKLEQL